MSAFLIDVSMLLVLLSISAAIILAITKDAFEWRRRMRRQDVPRGDLSGGLAQIFRARLEIESACRKACGG